MKPFYLHTTTNFGDHMNAWLWPRLIPELLERDDDIRLIGIGSLLKADIARLAGRIVIFGTGSGYGPPPQAETVAQWKIYGVRGPLTARQYGLDPALGITDGAWLVNKLPEYADQGSHTGGTVFVPHWTSAVYGNWKPVMEMAEIDYIDPMDDGPSVLKRLATAKLAVVESLHGAIFADYFGTPWVPIASQGRVLSFKWLDWCLSLDLPYSPLTLPPSDMVDFLTQGRKPVRSLPNLMEMSFDPEMFRATPVAAPQSAGQAYRMKIALKRRAARIRDGVFDGLRRMRDSTLMGSWNRGYREDLAGYLQQVAARPGFLSEPAIRAQRIEQLNDALNRLRGDNDLPPI